MNRLPDPVERGLRDVLRARTGRTPHVRAARPIPGGCINDAVRVSLDTGEDLFLKWNQAPPPDFFRAEAQGLRALARCPSVRVPEVLGFSVPDQEPPGWLALEFVPAGRPPPDYPERLGAGLADLHRSDRESGPHVSSRRSAGAEPEGQVPGERPAWGWPRDNYIGSLPQVNTPRRRWADFWWSCRLEPQLERARDYLSDRDCRRLVALADRLGDLVAVGEADGPALLHGDLWSGNVYPDSVGRPVLVDPAVYRGHREVDLAMAALFGGFPEGFFQAYAEAWPSSRPGAEARRAVYQLYPLLVHVNLFGASYLSGLRRALDHALA